MYPLNIVLGCAFLIFLLFTRFIVSNKLLICQFTLPSIFSILVILSLQDLIFFNLQGKRNKKLFWLPAIAPLISVVLSTMIVYFTKADRHGVKIVKHIKEGINPSSAHQLQLTGPHVGQAAKTGLISAIIALAVSLAIGIAFSQSNKLFLIDIFRFLMVINLNFELIN